MKYLALATLLLSSQVAIAQVKEPTDKEFREKSEQSLSKFEKDFLKSVDKDKTYTLDYELKIKYKGVLMFDGSFQNNSSELFSIMAGLMNSSSVNNEQRLKTDSQKGMNQGVKVDLDNELDSVGIRLVTHVDKASKNLWTQFIFENAGFEKTDVLSIITNADASAGQAEMGRKPNAVENKNEFIVLHQRDKPTKFLWKDTEVDLKVMVN